MLAGNVPFRTWYSNIPITVSEFIAMALPESVLRSLLKAALLGATTVISVVLARIWRRAGWEARRPVHVREEEGVGRENVPLSVLRVSFWEARASESVMVD
jgi:hypothetical protein